MRNNPTICLVALLLLTVPGLCAYGGECTDFEDLQAGTMWSTGDTFTSQGFQFSLNKFFYYPSGETDSGIANPGSNEFALPDTPSSQTLWLSNVNCGLDFSNAPALPQCLSFEYGVSGGNVNLEINGDLLNEETVGALDGQTAGNVLVRVYPHPDNDDYTGRIDLYGNVQTLKVGGQEFYIDNLCLFCTGPEPSEGEIEGETGADFPIDLCLNFYGLSADFDAGVGEPVFILGVPFTTSEFFWLPDGSTSSGTVSVTENVIDGVPVLALDNINLGYTFGSGVNPPPCISIFYVESGGNINLEINGDLRNVEDFADLNGQSVGGVSVFDFPYDGELRVLHLQGIASSFKLGGQELFLEKICPYCQEIPVSECTDFEDLQAGRTWDTGDTFTSQGFQFSLTKFFYYPSGETDSGIANAGGNDSAIPGTPFSQTLWLSNVNCGLDFSNAPALPQCLSFEYGVSGGNVNLEINGDLLNEETVGALDGQTAGNVLVRVYPHPDNDDYTGRIDLYGNVQTLKVGGQEFYIDNLCLSCEGDSVEGEDDPFAFFKECVDFSTMEEGLRAGNHEVLNVQGVRFWMTPFFYTPEDSTADGYAQVVVGSDAYPQLVLNDINLGYDFANEPPVPSCLTFSYEYNGGIVNLEVNGSLRVENDIADLNGQFVGGVLIRISQDADGRDALQLLGTVYNFKIGGQNFILHEICPYCEEVDPIEGEEVPGFSVDVCLDFNDLPWIFEAQVDETVFVNGVPFRTSEFFLYPQGSSRDGFVKVSMNDTGDGQILWLNNINLGYTFGPGVNPPPCLSIYYDYRGGNVNLEINDDLLNVESIDQLDGKTAGNVLVKVYQKTEVTGRIELSGWIGSFKIGGQELYLEKICPFCEQSPVEGEAEGE
ncbi:MAG TPA: hypothetical protein PKN92_06385, partial [Candidatus Hydrogenedentes bacterium]|nr:hypothetical protein [Candidatus Hydrogenedentota bacterium]